jgi:argininosuccinate lyase
MQGVLFNKGEPHGDMLPMLEPPKVALLAMIRAMTSMGYYRGVLGNMTPQKEKLLEYVRTGFSCSSEVSSFLVKEKNYGPRRAHRITATMVRMARERGIKAYEATGALLDEAARFAEEAEPNLSTEKLLELLDPKGFIASHSHTGGTSRDQAERMIASREQLLGETGKRIHERRQSVEAAIQELHKLADQFISE